VAKKHILTNEEIEKDIISSLEHPPKESERSYKRSTLFDIILALVLIVIEFIYPIFILWFLIALILFSVVIGVFHYLRLKNKIKSVSVNDYDITSETVHSVSEEHYTAKSGSSRHRLSNKVSNYTIRFENEKVWRVPKELYTWDERLRTYDMGIYNSAHRGDTMIVVTERSSGNIAVAYSAEIFEYNG